MSKSVRVLLLVLSGLVLSACHADVTYRIDLHSNGTATVAVLETVDEQLYQMAQSGGGDPFDVAGLTRRGWTVVKRGVDEDGNHLLEIARTVPFDSLSQVLNAIVPANARAQTGIRPAITLHVSRTHHVLSDVTTLRQTIPPIVAPSSTDAQDPFAGMDEAMTASMLSMHLELRAPGTVVAGNGERTGSGYMRWPLNLSKPTKIVYSVRAWSIMSIAAMVAVLLIAASIIAIVVVRLFSQRRTVSSTAT